MHFSPKKSSIFLTLLPFFAAFLVVTEAKALRCATLFKADKLVSQRTLLVTSPQAVVLHRPGVPVYEHPVIVAARELKIYPDFKYLADLQLRSLSAEQKNTAELRARVAEKSGGKESYIRSLVEALFEASPELLNAPEHLTKPLWQVKGSSIRGATVHYIEQLWSQLIKNTPKKSTGSLIPQPYPIIIPGSRFQESYYWDSYFGIKALIKSGRLELATMQAENFLFMIENYGLVPNGIRDYYLSRSQPPVLASMIREIAEAYLKAGRTPSEVKQWLATRALPLITRDYENFWMNPKTRFDKETGLNHHWDSADTPRPERHSSDREESIAKTYRDVRAEAESGKDFTDAFQGNATQVAGVLLNSVLFRLETDVAWMYRMTDQIDKAKNFENAASLRRNSMNQQLWDPKTRSYQDFHLQKRQRVNTITADTFAVLWAGVASQGQAAGVKEQLVKLEKVGGIMASEVNSGKQWDAPYGWAPHQFFAIDGLRKYGFIHDARRIADNWTTTIDKIFNETGKILEKVDVIRASKPEETGEKYETQEGFLWTNSVYLWALTDVLGYKLERIPAK